MKNVFFYSFPGNKKTLLLHYKKLERNLNKIDTKHSNTWEISEILRCFLSLGWNVELVDRNCTSWSPSRSYDLFISNASGSLGDNFVRMAKQIPDVKTILYAAGPAVDISDRLVDERYENFRNRHGIVRDTNHLRTFRTDIDRIMSYVSEVICIDDNGFSTRTYQRFGKPIYLLRPSSVLGSIDWRLNRFNKIKSRFILFLGNGFIAKGGDVVIDSFTEFPNAHLDICGPYKDDKYFWNFYESKLKRMKNVTLNGFVSVGSRKYFNLVSRSTWQLHNAAAEGSATSVTTLIQSGILPISNFETGVDISDFGISIRNERRDFVNSTKNSIEEALLMKEDKLREFMKNMYYAGDRFSQTSFKHSLVKIIHKIIN